jgi:hypothetical protein
MGWVQEIIDLFGKLKFFEIVYEYEQGLYFLNGTARERPIRSLKKSELEDIVKAEKETRKAIGGFSWYSCYIPFARPELPEGYRRSKIHGGPRSPKRYAKNLKPGVYFNWPIISEVITRSQQETVLNLNNISVMTVDSGGDSRVMNVSCNIRYKLIDLYKAYNAVHNYETSLKDYTLAILAKHSRGKKACDWKDPVTINTLEADVEKELRNLVTDKWGLKIFKVYGTDIVPCNVQRLLCENNKGDYNPEITPTINQPLQNPQ